MIHVCTPSSPFGCQTTRRFEIHSRIADQITYSIEISSELTSLAMVIFAPPGARASDRRVPALGEPRSHVFTVTLVKRSPRGPNPSCNCPNLEYGTGGDQRSPVDAHNGRHGARGALHAGHQHKPRPVEQREVERERLSTPPHAAQAATCCSAASKALRSSVLQPPGERNRWVLVDYGWICSHDARDSSAEQSAHVS